MKTPLFQIGDGLAFVRRRLAKEIMVHRIGVCCATGATGLGVDEFLPERVGEAGNDLVLYVEKVGYRLIEALGPNVARGLGVEQLHVDAQPIPPRCTLPSST